MLYMRDHSGEVAEENTPMKATLRTIRVWLLACVFAITTLIAPMPQAHAQGGLIRDAEIEQLLREYANPMFRAAGLSPRAVKVYIIADNTLNAFVAGGQRVFVHTGLLTRTRTPNELRGVLAHETGHIAGAHLAKLGIAVENMTTQSILAMLLAAAAVAGGAAMNNTNVAQSGQGIMLGGAELARRNLLAYVRVQESAADQAAAKYMRKTGHSLKGMLDLFQRMGNRALASSQFSDPYTRSHPMAFDRIRALRTEAKKSPYYNKKEDPKIMHRHKLMQAKLIGYMSPNQVIRRYPPSDDSTAAHYARAIAYFRVGKMQKSVDELNILAKREPKNPYFWELAGEALLNGGQIDHSIKAFKRAIQYAPNQGLIRITYATALIAKGGKANAQAALKQLQRAKRSEDHDTYLHRQMAVAYAKLGDIGRADLSTAESYVRVGNVKLAKRKAGAAKTKLKKGTPSWRRADDILKLRDPQQ